ncbi:uncharacterized protein LOC141676774 [Apium graveolens]|uniref:uncharacterized protein LOC141676774 n=1 Tax=Apium graveolens TaxID=4045 RepID=UPI003D79C98E
MSSNGNSARKHLPSVRRHAGCEVILSKSGIKKSFSYKAMKLELIVEKLYRKVLFAIVEEDFVDFLFSILTIPLGSVLSLLGDNSDLGSLDNLYKSIEDLNVEKLAKSWDLKYKLLYPIVAPDFFCKALEHPAIARGGFASKPGRFMVTDDLVVTPLTSTCSISALKPLQVPITGVQETLKYINVEEALCILKASINSASTLTEILKETDF